MNSQISWSAIGAVVGAAVSYLLGHLTTYKTGDNCSINLNTGVQDCVDTFTDPNILGFLITIALGAGAGALLWKFTHADMVEKK